MERIPVDGVWECLRFQILFTVGVLPSSLSRPCQWTKWICHYQQVSHDHMRTITNIHLYRTSRQLEQNMVIVRWNRRQQLATLLYTCHSHIKTSSVHHLKPMPTFQISHVHFILRRKLPAYLSSEFKVKKTLYIISLKVWKHINSGTNTTYQMSEVIFASEAIGKWKLWI